jgi:hypothetical protein
MTDNCSAPFCNKRIHSTVNGVNYCRTHSILGNCLIRKKDGSACGCMARRRVNGVDTCMRHVPSNTKAECCSICLEDVEEGTKATKCGHYFHKNCLQDWQARPNGENCPMCRTALKRKSLETVRHILVSIAGRTSSPEEFADVIMSTFEVGDFSLINIVLGSTV